MEAVALAPGVPGIEAQEKRDRQRGVYRRLLESGVLTMADGLRVPNPGALIDRIREWDPAAIVCDRFRLDELRDTNPPAPVIPRVTRWSESSADIRALRKMAKDGPLSCAVESRSLLRASLGVCRVKNDDGGSVRILKAKDNAARDDVAAAFALAAGHLARHPPRRASAGRYLGIA